MKVPEENTQVGSSTNEITSQKRRPPKLRPAKASKQTTPVDDRSEGIQQRHIGGSQISQLNSSSEYPNSNNAESEDSLDSSKLERIPEKPQRNRRTRVRHDFAPSAEKDERDGVGVLDRAQRSNSQEEKVRETRVRRITSPEVENQKLVRASDAHPTGEGGELLQSKPDEVVEATEEVTTRKSGDQLKLRLDLNLDIEVELKAKIRGDLTLQLLQ